jgi:hypothetical protein
LVIVAIADPLRGLEQVVIGIELVAGVVLGFRIWYRHKFYHEAGKYYGVKVRWYRPVPIRDERFAAWCERHGVHPPSKASRSSESTA